MFEKLKANARAAAEQTGLMAPTPTEAQTAAEKHRVALLAAQSAVNTASAALDAAHDRSAEPQELTRLEAALVAARAEFERCERRVQAAERRLDTARAAEAATSKAKGRARLSELLAERESAADAIAHSFKSLGAALARMDKADAQLAELQAAGHVSGSVVSGYNFGPGATRSRLQIEFEEIVVGRVANRPAPFAEWVSLANRTATVK